MHNRCWLFFALDAKPTSLRKAVARRIGETEPVVVVERAVSAVRSPYQYSLKTRLENSEYRPFHLPERIPLLGRALHGWNVRRLRSELDRLCPPGDRYVCYDSPMQYHLVGRLNEACRVYFAIDDRTVTLAGAAIAGEQQAESELLGRVDRVVCVSDTLARVLQSRVPPGAAPPIHVLDNGFDERLFDPDVAHPEPASLQGVPRPRGLVSGHVSERIDWDGIAACRHTRPDVHWVFVGPADQGMARRVDSIGSHLRPSVPVADMPGWIQHCDFCAVPYRLNAFTQASSPLKAMESLALGAPTLATPVPALQQFDGAIQWVQPGDGGSYRAAVENMLAQARTPAAVRNRQTAVAPYTLASRVEGFLGLF